VTWRPSAQGDDEPRSVADSLRRVARTLGAPEPDVLKVLYSGWSDAVGETVAAHARPVSLRDGVLVVQVEESAWATQLRFLEADILGRLEQSAGMSVAERIEVRVRPVPGRRGGRRRG